MPELWKTERQVVVALWTAGLISDDVRQPVEHAGRRGTQAQRVAITRLPSAMDRDGNRPCSGRYQFGKSRTNFHRNWPRVSIPISVLKPFLRENNVASHWHGCCDYPRRYGC